MESIFEPHQAYLDPTSHLDPSYLSFASFADLGLNPGALLLDVPQKSNAPSDVSSSSSSPFDPFQIVASAFDAPTPGLVGDVGILHAPVPTLLADVAPAITHRPSFSSDWTSPATPSSARFSVSSSSYPSTSATTVSPGFAWDDVSAAGSSSCAATTPISLGPLRVASAPALGAAVCNPQMLKTVASMPALKEEDATTAELAEELEWAFGDHGIGHGLDDTIFSAFQEDAGTIAMDPTWSLHPPVELVTPQAQPDGSAGEINWLPQQSAQVADYVPTYTINPMAVMAPSADVEPRPLSAPSEETTLALGVPTTMSRSISTDGNIKLSPFYNGQARFAPAASFAADAGAMHPNILPRAVPTTPTRGAGAAGLAVTIQPTASTYAPPSSSPGLGSPFVQYPEQPMPIVMARAETHPLPARKASAGPNANAVASSSSLLPHLARAQVMVQMQEARDEAKRDAMRREATARRVSMADASVMHPQHGVAGMPPSPHHFTPPFQRHPHGLAPPPGQAIMGWEGPSAQTAALPVLTTTPLMTVHPVHAHPHPHGMPLHHPHAHLSPPPPPMFFVPGPHEPRIVHPPPFGRRVSGLPSPTRRRQSATGAPKTPGKPRSPSGKRKAGQPMQPGGFSWGEATFINFTSDDAEKLLTGVAPSGSQGKRKRDDAPGAGADDAKRARSDE